MPPTASPPPLAPSKLLKHRPRSATTTHANHDATCVPCPPPREIRLRLRHTSPELGTPHPTAQHGAFGPWSSDSVPRVHLSDPMREEEERGAGAKKQIFDFFQIFGGLDTAVFGRVQGASHACARKIKGAAVLFVVCTSWARGAAVAGYFEIYFSGGRITPLSRRLPVSSCSLLTSLLLPTDLTSLSLPTGSGWSLLTPTGVDCLVRSLSSPTGGSLLTPTGVDCLGSLLTPTGAGPLLFPTGTGTRLTPTRLNDFSLAPYWSWVSPDANC